VSAAFALAAHAALARAGAAFFDAWDASLTVGVSAPVAVKVFLDQVSEGMGDFGEVVVGQYLITFLDAGRAAAQARAVVAANGRTYTLERKVFDDGVTARWTAARG
jgi:hypothetical protein